MPRTPAHPIHSGTPAHSAPTAATQRADQAVAGEQRGALAGRAPVAGQQRLLGRQEHADVAGRRVHRADEADESSGQKLVNTAKPSPVAIIRSDTSCSRLPARRTRGRAGRRASVSAAEPSSVAVTTTPMRVSDRPSAGEVRREHDADEPVAEGADPARLEQHGRVATGAGREEPHPGIIPQMGRWARWATSAASGGTGRHVRRRGRRGCRRPPAHGAGDRQAEAAAAGVERAGLVEPRERLEDALAHLGRDRRAVVGDGQLASVAGASSAHRRSSSRRGARRCRTGCARPGRRSCRSTATVGAGRRRHVAHAAVGLAPGDLLGDDRPQVAVGPPPAAAASGPRSACAGRGPAPRGGRPRPARRRRSAASRRGRGRRGRPRARCGSPTAGCAARATPTPRTAAGGRRRPARRSSMRLSVAPRRSISESPPAGATRRLRSVAWIRSTSARIASTGRQRPAGDPPDQAARPARRSAGGRSPCPTRRWDTARGAVASDVIGVDRSPIAVRRRTCGRSAGSASPALPPMRAPSTVARASSPAAGRGDDVEPGARRQPRRRGDRRRRPASITCSWARSCPVGTQHGGEPTRRRSGRSTWSRRFSSDASTSSVSARRSSPLARNAAADEGDERGSAWRRR